MSEQTLRVVPKNGHVYDPVRKTFLKHVEQTLPRTPHWLSAVRMGDLVVVADNPKTPAPAKAAEKAPADKVSDKKPVSKTTKASS